MSKNLFIAEKPSVAQEFAKALKEPMTRCKGYLESQSYVVTWCVGHLVTMSYPNVYDPLLKQWRIETLPFLPEKYLYEIIPNVQEQFNTVKSLLNRDDVACIYVCTDSGREGEYIYRLVDQMANVPSTKERRRVWIDSQTEEEILRGIREAKPLSSYNSLSDAAFLRAKEDYLMGINFSRLLTIKYGYHVRTNLNIDKSIISVGRVMTCVLGMVVRREREIRAFKKTNFYRIIGNFKNEGASFSGEWRSVEGSHYFNSPILYKENGFLKREDAEECMRLLQGYGNTAQIINLEKKTEKKNPPLLFNLAELQNECSKLFKISPDETLQIVQELYEKKLVTYPRTDARVLSSAVAKEITKNLHGIAAQTTYLKYTKQIKDFGLFAKIAKSRYTDDKQITDHYAIIPTGQGVQNLGTCSQTAQNVYDRIVRRFLAIFYPPAEYKKIAIETQIGQEHFFANFKILAAEGYKAVLDVKNEEKSSQDSEVLDSSEFEFINKLKKGDSLSIDSYEIKEGETTPPKRYNSGSLILAMENAGQLIEDEELRAQIKGSGIGTSATRAEILSKLMKIEYLDLNKKTQIITPTKLGEIIFEVVNLSIPRMLDPDLTASWEKGLTMVANGTIGEQEYMNKLETFIKKMCQDVKTINNQYSLGGIIQNIATYY